MTDHLDTLIDALDSRARTALLELEAATQRVRVLEAENQQLRQRLDGLQGERGGGASAAEPLPVMPGEAVGEHAPGGPVAAFQAPDRNQPPAAETPPPSPQALLEQWYQRYPATFFKSHTRPLKVGIHQDMIAREPWPAKLIRRTLANYVNLPRYLKSVRVGVERVDLDGQPAGTLTEEDARHAREQLDALQARKREREARLSAERMSRKLAELSARHEH